MDPSTIGLLLDKIADYVTAMIKADKAWEKEMESENPSHYCNNSCDACRGRERCEQIRAEIVELLTAKTSSES